MCGVWILVHERVRRGRGIPLILTHGWRSSVGATWPVKLSPRWAFHAVRQNAEMSHGVDRISTPTPSPSATRLAYA